MKRKILHLANDYSGSSVYQNLIRSIDGLGFVQVVYTAIRNKNLIGKNKIQFKNLDSEIIYSNILTIFDRISFFTKIKKIFLDLEGRQDIKSFDLVHAHTWYSDGAVALQIYKKYNIPYVVTIRNSDLNVFYKYMFHLEQYGREILINAKEIVFISNVYKDRFIATKLFEDNKDQLGCKLNVLYNGIDKYWLNNIQIKRKYKSAEPFKVLYIGKFDKGKNVPRLIKAIKILNERGISVTLTIVGGGGKDEKSILKDVSRYNFIDYRGYIYDKGVLRKIFSECDLFAMPSKAETFGLVYLEAVSQGLPILNTINEGIYGIYPSIGESVIYNDVKSICDGINEIRLYYDNYNFNPEEIVSNHDWSRIAADYETLYNALIYI